MKHLVCVARAHTHSPTLLQDTPLVEMEKLEVALSEALGQWADVFGGGSGEGEDDVPGSLVAEVPYGPPSPPSAGPAGQGLPAADIVAGPDMAGGRGGGAADDDAVIEILEEDVGGGDHDDR